MAKGMRQPHAVTWSGSRTELTSRPVSVARIVPMKTLTQELLPQSARRPEGARSTR